MAKKAPAKSQPQANRWLIFDTETTGLLKPLDASLADQPRIIEIALVETDGKSILREYSQLIDPECEITDEITKITGIKTADVKGKPLFKEALRSLTHDWFLGAYGLLAHNLAFDHGMLLTELRRIGAEHRFPWPPNQLCSVEETQHMLGRRMKLTELYEKVMGKPLAQTHRALDDTRALTEVVLKEGLLI